jgi:hypothetical protein
MELSGVGVYERGKEIRKAAAEPGEERKELDGKLLGAKGGGADDAAS